MTFFVTFADNWRQFILQAICKLIRSRLECLITEFQPNTFQDHSVLIHKMMRLTGDSFIILNDPTQLITIAGNIGHLLGMSFIPGFVLVRT